MVGPKQLADRRQREPSVVVLLDYPEVVEGPEHPVTTVGVEVEFVGDVVR